MSVLDLLSFRPDTAHVIDFKGHQIGHQVLSLPSGLKFHADIIQGQL